MFHTYHYLYYWIRQSVMMLNILRSNSNAYDKNDTNFCNCKRALETEGQNYYLVI